MSKLILKMYAVIFIATGALQIHIGVRSCDMGTKYISKDWMSKEKDKRRKAFEVVVGTVFLTFSLVYFVAGICLLKGLLKNNSQYVSIWQIMTFLCFVPIIFQSVLIYFAIGTYEVACVENEAKIVVLWTAIRLPFFPALQILLGRTTYMFQWTCSTIIKSIPVHTISRKLHPATVFTKPSVHAQKKLKHPISRVVDNKRSNDDLRDKFMLAWETIRRDIGFL